MILVLAAYIALLSLTVSKLSGNQRKRWILSGLITAFLLPFFVYIIFLNGIAPLVNAGIGVAFVGMLFASATVITGFVFLFIGYTDKNSRGTNNKSS